MLPIRIKTRVKNIHQVRIVPRKGYYITQVIYGQAVKQANVNPASYAGIDLGINVRREVA